MTSKKKRTGRPIGGDGGNRERILDVARAQFAAKGFRSATMRGIAVEAGFDVALVAHYFGSKDGLFAATMQLPDGIDQMLEDALAGPLEAQGGRLTRGYLGVWEATATGEQMRALARAGLSSESAGANIRDRLIKLVDATHASQSLKGRRTGFGLAIAHLLGVAIARHLVRLPVMVEISFENLVMRVSPAVQIHLQTSD